MGRAVGPDDGVGRRRPLPVGGGRAEVEVIGGGGTAGVDHPGQGRRRRRDRRGGLRGGAGGVGRQPPDPAVATELGEPEVAVAAGGDVLRKAVGGRRRLLGDGSRGADPPNAPRIVEFREPQVAVGSGRDGARVAVGRQAGGELGDRAGGGDPSDPSRVGRFGEPQVAVGPGGDRARARCWWSGRW